MVPSERPEALSQQTPQTERTAKPPDKVIRCQGRTRVDTVLPAPNCSIHSICSQEHILTPDLAPLHELIGPSALHEIIGVISELVFNLVLIAIVIWLYFSGRLQTLWNDITEFSIFGANIKKRSAREAANLDSGGVPGETDESMGDTVIWATSGRRPSATIAALIGKGYVIREVDPLSQNVFDDLPEFASKDEKPVIVTNLKHGANYIGGKKFCERVREKSPDARIIVFTSEAAKNRRRKHIDSDIRPLDIATNEPELETILQVLFD